MGYGGSVADKIHAKALVNIDTAGAELVQVQSRRDLSAMCRKRSG